jgi:hypothetical protein
MWLANALYQPTPRAVHQVDPAHADTTTAPGSYQALAYAAPPADPVGATSPYPGMEWVVSTGGLTIDQTPEDHQDGSVKGVYMDPVGQTIASGRAHTEDYGASRFRNHAQPGLQWAREHYTSSRFEVPLDTQTNPVALQRGLNGLPENNPDGFRNGFDFQPLVDRKFEVGVRYHDEHVAEVNTAAIVKNLPVPGGPYSSPFSMLARAITQPVRPMIRRDPPPIDAPIVADGSESLYAADSRQWVVS